MSNKKEFVIKFDENSRLWESSDKLNTFIVSSTISNWRMMLSVRGYLFVREMYESLGLPFTRESITAGWHESSNEPMFNIREDEQNHVITITFSAEEDIRDYF